jgi:Ca2+-transporting ATPase
MWHSKTVEQTLEELTTAPGGLSEPEALARLQAYGPNQLAEKPRPTFLHLLLAQLKGFVVIMLIVAALLSAVLGEWVEAGAILAIVVLNAVLGVVQESRAEEALAALKKMAAPEAQVLRGGRRISVPAGELVPGDVVLLEAGNFIPADLRLLETINLKVEEAALTGESSAVQKDAALVFPQAAGLGDRKNCAYMGTLVSYGRGRGVVTATGMGSELGKIASLLQQVEEEDTPLQKRLDQLGKVLGWGALAVCALVFLIGAVESAAAGSFSVQKLVDLFMVAVSLAIAAVPEGLPAIVTISLALGMREMVQRHALVRRLASVETLGSATVICTDKTGTLTQNEMTVTRLWAGGVTLEVTGAGYTPQGQFKRDGHAVSLADYPAAATTLWLGVLNNDAGLEYIEDADGSPQDCRITGDPTEGALLVAAAKSGIIQEQLAGDYPRRQEVPFDSERKRMATIHHVSRPRPEDSSPFYDQQKHGWYVVAVKGAPDGMLELCTRYQRMDDSVAPLDAATRAAILAANDQMTGQALRVLGLAYRLEPEMPGEISSRALENNLVFAGLAGMIDPPRPEVGPALEEARAAGIRTVMITGDFPNTARAIAESTGLLRPGRQLLSGAQLDGLGAAALAEAVRQTDVYARVSPEHKMRIIDALRTGGEVVAMTGDGVNDAPAIKRADIGVAMGITGTDVAKQAADMVLTDDNYASIVAAIEQGRIIYSNIRKFVYYLLSCNLAEIAIIFLATLFTGGSPISALQLLWLNLLTDGAPAMALGAEKGDPGIMRQPPRPPSDPIINRPMRVGIALQTVAITAATLLAYWIGLGVDGSGHYASTMAFATLSISELLRAYTARSETVSIFRLGIFSNKWMNIAVPVSLALVLAVLYVPGLRLVFNTEALSLAQWLEILPLVVLPSAVAELSKVFFLRKIGV